MSQGGPGKTKTGCRTPNYLRGDMVDCHHAETLSTQAETRLTTVSEGRQSTMSSRTECYIYFIIQNVPFLQQFSMLYERRHVYDLWHMPCDIQNCHPDI